MPAKNRQEPLGDARFRDEFAYFRRDFMQSAAVGANRQIGTGLTKHAPRLKALSSPGQRGPGATQSPQTASARLSASAR